MLIHETPDLIKVTRYARTLRDDFDDPDRLVESQTDVHVYELRPGDVISKDHDRQRRYRVVTLPVQQDVPVDGVLHPDVWTVEVEDAA